MKINTTVENIFTNERIAECAREAMLTVKRFFAHAKRDGLTEALNVFTLHGVAFFTTVRLLDAANKAEGAPKEQLLNMLLRLSKELALCVLEAEAQAEKEPTE